MSNRSKLSLGYLFGFLTIALLGLVVVVAHIGAVKLPFSTWFAGKDSNAFFHHILFNIRLPRLIATVFVGGGLALSGAALQGLFRNPLVDPGIIGVSSGAALFAALYIVVFEAFLPDRLTIYGLPVFAFVGGWLITLLLYRLSSKNGQINIAIMLLMGIAIAAFAGALTGILIYISNDTQLRTLTFWSMGSLSGINWQKTLIIVLVITIISPLIWREYRALNALTLGEKEASNIGFSVKSIKKRLIFYVAVITGTSVAFVGAIGFVGLIIPHLMRGMVGGNYRYLLPASLIGGAMVLLIADTLARTVASPAEVPVGIFTALFGSPFLIYVVAKKVR